MELSPKSAGGRKCWLRSQGNGPYLYERHRLRKTEQEEQVNVGSTTSRVLGLALVAGFALGASNPAEATPESRAAVLFLLIEPGARASGMGEAYVSIADDATAASVL